MTDESSTGQAVGNTLWLVDAAEDGRRDRWLCSNAPADATECH